MEPLSPLDARATRFRLVRRAGAWFALLLGFAITASAQVNIEVKGLGFFQDRELDARLAFLQGFDPEATVPLDAVVLEDSALLLLQQVKREGYLEPTITGRFQTKTGVTTTTWKADYSFQLPVQFKARHAVFHVRPGQLFFYRNVSVEGLPFMEEEERLSFFVPDDFIVNRRSARAYTPENLERRIGSLVAALEASGYRSASVEQQEVTVDPSTGAVDMELKISPGPLHRVERVSFVDVHGRTLPDFAIPASELDQALTRSWERGLRQRLLNHALRAGFPDAAVKMETVSVEPGQTRSDGAATRMHHLRFVLDRGKSAVLGGLRFEGDPGTRRSMLRRQVGLETGSKLDRLATAAGRRKLMGLGIFDEVELRYEPPDGPQRTAVYTLEPAQRKELSLRAGWGSYELARIGLEWERLNPFGRAHRYTVSLKQSLKSRAAQVDYSIPRVLGSGANAYLRAEYSFREEVSFDRNSTGIAFGLASRLASGWRLAAEYGISLERTEREDELGFASENDATVAGIELNASLDRRDSALSPSSGYSLRAGYQAANEILGATVNFHRFRLGASFHREVADGLILHLGAQAGYVFSFDEASANIPFNERFFQGGADSVRGYEEGLASPLDSDGDEIGAESFTLLNLELEQRLAKNISTVLFLDSVINARAGFFEEGVDHLHVGGLGLRYHSPVGPIRLEYGHNLNPRPKDEAGRLHFAIGFPF